MDALLTPQEIAGSVFSVAAQSATGISLPKWSGESRIEFALRLFSCLCVPFSMGRRAGRSNAGRCSTGKANPSVCPPTLSLVAGSSSNELEPTAMPKPCQSASAPVLPPSRAIGNFWMVAAAWIFDNTPSPAIVMMDARGMLRAHHVLEIELAKQPGFVCLFTPATDFDRLTRRLRKVALKLGVPA